MKLEEFQALIREQRKAQQLTNAEKIAKIITNKTNKEKDR